MNMNKIVIVAVLIGLLACLSFGCTRITEESAVNEKVTIGYLPIAVDLATFVAQEKGFFAEEGLEVELVQFATSNQVAEALIAGRIDASSYFAYPVVFAVEQSQPGTFKEIGTVIVSSEHPFLFILAGKNDSSIKTLADLEGKTVGMFPGSTTQAQLRHALKTVGVDPSTVNMQPIAAAQQLGALSAGSVDALFALEPTATIGELKGISRKVENVEKYLPEPNYNAISAVTNSYRSENPKAVAKIVAAQDRAIDFIRENPEEARMVLTKYTSLDNETAVKAGIGFPLKSEDAKDISKAQEYADILFAEGDLKERVDVSLIFD
jgi:NitT/TauT family transport system substrate-binding protein